MPSPSNESPKESPRAPSPVSPANAKKHDKPQELKPPAHKGVKEGEKPQELKPPAHKGVKEVENKSKPRKPYEEIGATFNGNEIKIRVPKSTSKPPKLTPSQLKLQQQCTCEDEDSDCSVNCGIEGGHAIGPSNKLNFQIPDDICEGLTNRTTLNSELVYCKKEHHDTMCNICNVTPKDAPKGVNAHKVMHPDKDVFVLKIGKQTDEPNRTGNIEVELVTPRAPAKAKPVTHSCKTIQCEEEDIPCCVPCRVCRVPRKRRGPRPRPCCS